jgi:transcriptional regulator with XRE-family HTH domain
MFLRLTQLQVADMLGISSPAYTAIETGKSCPGIDRVERVAAILRTTAAQLLTPNAFAKSVKKPNFSVVEK